MPDDHPSFAELVAQARRQSGLELTEVAAAAGWTPAQVADAELGRYAPTPDQLWRLAYVLGIDPERLAVAALRAFAPPPEPDFSA